jgi:hypothetical protein
MKIGQYEDEKAFLNACLIRAADQRKSDINKSEKGRPHVTFRGKSDMCLAYSTIDHNFYIGYSAIAGGIVGNHDYYRNKSDPDQPSRRFERIRSLVHVSDPLDKGVISRPIVNCAEACALSIAVSWGQEIQNLVFVTYYPCDGKFARTTQDGYPVQKDPCDNCLGWLRNSRGYAWRGDVSLRKD